MTRTKTKNVEEELTVPPDAEANIKRIRANAFCSKCGTYEPACGLTEATGDGRWQCVDCDQTDFSVFGGEGQ